MTLRTTKEQDVETFRAIREKYDFLAFSSILSRKVNRGEARVAGAMLLSLGVEPAIVWKAVEEFPVTRSRRMIRLGLRLATQQAIYLAHLLGSTAFPDGVAGYDWGVLLTTSLEAARESTPPLPPLEHDSESDQWKPKP